MRIVLWLSAAIAFVGALLFAGVMGLYLYYARDLPDLDTLEARSVFQTARIMDRHGALIEEIMDPEGGRRTLIPLSDMPGVLIDATIAAEDGSFYDNPGFEVRAIVRAAWQWLQHGEPQSGASTITQQLVKNTLLGPEQTPERKAKEAYLAMELTRRYSKDKILEMYLNEIFYGNHAYGVEAAAKTYFGKSARNLSLAEATFMAALPQAPSLHDPYTRMFSARERQQYILEQMVRHRMVTEDQARTAYEQPLEIRPHEKLEDARAPHFVSYVRQQLEARFGTDALFRSGLQVTTSLDLSAQQVAEQAVREQVAALHERYVNNAALVALDPRSGEVLAMVGSADFWDESIDGQVNVALADRQPGSTLKPFTYLAAFARGWSPATLLLDLPTTFGADYRPRNFDDRFRGPVTVRQALAQSLNVPAVEALEFVGIDELLALLHRLGVRGLNDPSRLGLAVTLGGGEVRLLDLTYAYGALANEGQQAGQAVASPRQGYAEVEPVSILRVTDHGGKVLYEHTPRVVEAADPRLVYQVTSILADNVARSPTFGPESALLLAGHAAAVKTGTTDRYVDAWTVGYTPSLVTGVWAGNTDGSPMRDVGGSLAAGSIWNRFMAEMLEGQPPEPFTVPPGLVEAEVCALSGLLPTPECQEVSGLVRDLFVPGVNLPTRQDDWHQRGEVCLANGKLATDLVPANARETRSLVELPARFLEWEPFRALPQVPKEDCSDVYRGDRKAEITGPRPSETIVGGEIVSVVGSAYVDDFAAYTLEIGPGASPDTWYTLTDRRPQGVDNGLLGVLSTPGMGAGQYTLRLRVFDNFENALEGTSRMTILPPPTAIPTPTPTPTASPTVTATPRPTATLGTATPGVTEPTSTAGLPAAEASATPTARAPGQTQERSGS